PPPGLVADQPGAGALRRARRGPGADGVRRADREHHRGRPGRQIDVSVRVGVFGLLGSGNLGNDGSLEAVLGYLRTEYPDARLGACSAPRSRWSASARTPFVPAPPARSCGGPGGWPPTGPTGTPTPATPCAPWASTPRPTRSTPTSRSRCRRRTPRPRREPSVSA